jgi:hypothetical protein
MSKTELDSIIKLHDEGKPFQPVELAITDEDCEIWVRFKTDPQRFLPKIFDGEWAHTHQHPKLGSIRVIKVITGNDEISRAIGRQGNQIFAYPWFA